MPVERTSADLTIHDGEYRSFEWFWAQDDSMPGLDAYEDLKNTRDRDDLLASLIYWGGLAPGLHPSTTRVNVENNDPLILAAKAGKHRFTAFREETGTTWIVYDHYLKKGQKRDKPGDRVVEKTIEIRTEYFARVKDGAYYERG